MRIEKIINCTGATLLIPQGAGDELVVDREPVPA